MLNSILEMVTKAKRALFLLQQKDHHMRRLIETNEIEWRRRHTELLAQTEDRMIEARRKAGIIVFLQLIFMTFHSNRRNSSRDKTSIDH